MRGEPSRRSEFSLTLALASLGQGLVGLRSAASAATRAQASTFRMPGPLIDGQFARWPFDFPSRCWAITRPPTT